MCVRTETCTQTFIHPAKFIQPKSGCSLMSSVDEWINSMSNVRTTDYDLAVKGKEVMVDSTTQMHHASPSCKVEAAGRRTPHVYFIYTKHTVKSGEMESGFVVARGWRKAGMKTDSLMDSGFLLEVMTMFWSQMVVTVARGSEYTKSH